MTTKPTARVRWELQLQEEFRQRVTPDLTDDEETIVAAVREAMAQQRPRSRPAKGS